MKNISLKLRDHYREKFLKYGQTPKGVDWKDKKSADIRYKIMLNVLKSNLKNKSILDIGCGYGGFYNFLKKADSSIKYYGIDIVEEMIDEAQKSCPSGIFYNMDFLNKNFSLKFDYMVCNGLLTQKLSISEEEMDKFSKKIIKKMFSLSNLGCCLNLMTSECNFYSNNLFYKCPKKTLDFCISEITKKFKIDHSYGLYEYTIYLYK